MFNKLGSVLACVAGQEKVKQGRALIAALKAVNQSNRKVVLAEQAVKAATSALAKTNAALALAQQEHRKAHTDFVAQYQAQQPAQPKPAQPK